MRKHYIETYTIDDDWKQSNPDKFHSEDCMNYFTEDTVNLLYRAGYQIEQVIRIGGNFCTIMYSGGN